FIFFHSSLLGCACLTVIPKKFLAIARLLLFYCPVIVFVSIAMSFCSACCCLLYSCSSTKLPKKLRGDRFVTRLAASINLSFGSAPESAILDSLLLANLDSVCFL